MKILPVSIFLILIVVGCRYKEGPAISFRSTYKRIEGYWQITKFTSNGIDSLKYYNDSCGSLAFIGNIDHETSDKEYYIFFNYMRTNEFAGTIKFNDNKTIMSVDFGNNSKTILGPIGKGKSEWKILKLTMKEFKITTDFNNLNYTLLYKKTTL